jgi:hypothetical protein
METLRNVPHAAQSNPTLSTVCWVSFLNPTYNICYFWVFCCRKILFDEVLGKL